MSTINYYLDRPDRKKQCPIMLSYNGKGKRFRYYTQLKISKCLWDEDKQITKKNFSGAGEYNALLDSYKELIRQIEREALFNKRLLTIDEIKLKFATAIGKQQSPTDFHTLFGQYLENSKTTKAYNTVKTLYSSYTKLKAFEKEKSYPLSFEAITKVFYDAYVSFLINDCKHLNNSVGRFIKALKFFMNYATDIGINKNMEFKKFKILQEEVDLIYHPDDELQKLLFLPLDDKSLYNVRENYCFACLTGLRFSDIANLKNTSIDDNSIKVWTVKTKDPIIVPLNKFAKEILERNKGQYGDRPLPPCYSSQKMNVYLKELGELCEINDKVRIVKFSGARRIESNNLKYELMSFHAARRTFITLCLEKGMRPEIVMQIVGIRKWETFKRYIKLTETVKVVEMNAKWNDSFQLRAV